MSSQTVEIDTVHDSDRGRHSTKRPVLETAIRELKRYLPAQAALKDFIHHNTLHGFQDRPFGQALAEASSIFGFNTFVPLAQYRTWFEEGRVKEEILHRVIIDRKGRDGLKEWKHKLLYSEYRNYEMPRIGQLRAAWKHCYHVDLDSLVHPALFRILCSYLDQGISIWNFPVSCKGFLESVRELEKSSFASFFHTREARSLFVNGNHSLENLMAMLVGDESLVIQYLFDQQFAHQGWSGIVSAIEEEPGTLLARKHITLRELIFLEVVLEIDALNYKVGKWAPLSEIVDARPIDLFAPVLPSELQEVLLLWQSAFEWSYYDEVLAGIRATRPRSVSVQATPAFQAIFCLDDRECSLRRYLEHVEPACQSFGTPGFFNVEFFYQPQGGKFYTKLCPAPLTPKYVVKEVKGKGLRVRDAHFAKHSHTLLRGWLISQTLGFWSAFKLFLNILKPSVSPASASSFNHSDEFASLTIEYGGHDHRDSSLQIGFHREEMVQRVEGLLRSIGLTADFAPLVYVIGHGSSSVNNPHYAAYDCGACSGRPGSVNARVICYMANHPEVREGLRKRNIDIPETTQFVAGLHDTTRDEIVFYDEGSLSQTNMMRHKDHQSTFQESLMLNARERSRRFDSINTRSGLTAIHTRVKERSVSLFQPRPELNHATNALCIIGRRELTKDLFLDRRSFLNSFDYRIDPEGKFLFNILKAAAPVCGGINLEYYFSRVDNLKLGAGTKLPHNVMGLFGVANGVDGDLRPGLPSQMIEVHDPVRLLIIVEHYPEVVLKTILMHASTCEWFANEWVHLIAVHPDNGDLYVFADGHFREYHPMTTTLRQVPDVAQLIMSESENIPVHIICKQ